MINIVTNEQRQFNALCDAIGLPNLKTDRQFLGRENRIKYRGELQVIVEGALAARSAAEWEEIFAGAGVPAGPVLTIAEVLEHPHIKARQLVKHFDGAEGAGRPISVTRLGFHLAGGNPDVASPPPKLSQDTADILGALGIDAQRQAGLAARGVI